MSGVYQYPTEINTHRNKAEFNDFEMSKQIVELKKEYACDLICGGQSKYESFARATKFHKHGLLIKDQIFPLGMMSKDNVFSVIKNSGIKLHPSYKFTASTYDHPSYWKMRSALLTTLAFKNTVEETYPLIVLDEYRHEELFK